ncbi:HIRAN domain-containing protein [Arcanobacterium phocae]|uniref:HIRAN domain-containing protein n=1 Tax=Arcanobacterium phocae TaxID=131112 RepID=UPI001C0F1016|nr:HIRAN domain-containing protein [Arcanobacterium phocae]
MKDIQRRGPAVMAIICIITAIVGPFTDNNRNSAATFFTSVFLIVGAIYLWNIAKKPPKETTSKTAITTTNTDYEKEKIEISPSTPSLSNFLKEKPLELWGKLPIGIEAVGEYYYQSAYKQIFKNNPSFSSYEGLTVHVSVLLVPEPDNKYDPNAVAVVYEERRIAYMPAEEAKKYHRPIAKLGAPLAVPGRIWTQKDGKDVHSRVTFRVPSPQNISGTLLSFADDEIELPLGARMHVIGEEHFMDVLRKYAPENGERCVLARLEKSIDFRPKSARERVDVFIGKERIGWLSDTQSTNMLPLVDFLEKHGRVGVARATIGGSVLKVEAFLYVARASEVSSEWVADIERLPSVKKSPTEQELREQDWEW